MPCRSGWTRLCLSIANNTGNNQVRIIHHGTKGGSQCIAQFTTFMNGAGNTRGEVTGKATRPGETLDETFQPGLIMRQLWIKPPQRAFKVQIGQVSGCSMSRSGDQKHIQVMLIDETVEMCIDHVNARTCSPVTKQTIFHLFACQRIFQKHIALKVNLSCSEIIGGALVADECREIVFLSS